MPRVTHHSRHRNARHARTAIFASKPDQIRKGSGLRIDIGLTLIILAFVLLFAYFKEPAQRGQSSATHGAVASPHVHVVVNLGEADLHPRQLAYDPARNGLWFWTSVLTGNGATYANRLYFYGIDRGQVQSWPIYSGDWSSQMLSGLAVAPNGEVWIGWNYNLVRFDPSSDTYIRYVLPRPQYPLPAKVIGNLPADLGIADLAVSQDGTVWIAVYASLSLTAFSPSSATFFEYPLPQNAGDPAKIAVAPSGHIVFTTDLAASHPGYEGMALGDFDMNTHATVIVTQAGRTLVVSPQGNTYIAVGHGEGLAQLGASERIASEKVQIAPVLQQHVLPFDIDNTAVTSDSHGRVWVAVAGQPDLARFDPSSGTIQEYQYTAPSVAAHPIVDLPLGIEHISPASGAVWLTHIVAMTCDSQGDLWYIRAGSDEIEEVTP